MIRKNKAFDPQRSADNTVRVKQWTLKPCQTSRGLPKGHLLQMRETAACICSHFNFALMIFSHMKKEMKSYWFLFQHVCVECQTQLGHLETIIVACQVGTHLMIKYDNHNFLNCCLWHGKSYSVWYLNIRN